MTRAGFVFCLLAVSCGGRKHLGNCEDICGQLEAGAVVEKLVCNCDVGVEPNAMESSDGAGADAGNSE